MPIKKTIAVLLLAVGTAFLCYFGIKTLQIRAQTKLEQTAFMPDFAIKNSMGTLFSKQNLRQSTPSVFIAFHPECEHCQYEAKSINEKQTALQNIQFVLFTSASDSVIRSFSKTYGLDTLKNVTVLSDSTGELRRLFDVKKIPTILIYNAQNQLVKRFNGEAKIEAIIKYATPQ